MAARKFFATVTSIGEFAVEFMEEGVLVFFGQNAPEELQEHAVVHDSAHSLTEDVVVGDTVRIGENHWKVLAVGNVANDNLRNLGHLVLKFNGLEEPEMRGDINVAEAKIPPIDPGIEVEITS
jgi:glucitol/sorbitol PTS system EIIA component